MQFRVVVKAGPDVGQCFPVPALEEFWIGRGTQSSTRLTDPSVSRMHCMLKLYDGKLSVQHRSQSSETLINGVPVRDAVLAVGDEIVAGETVLHVESADVAESVTIAPGRRSESIPGRLSSVNRLLPDRPQHRARIDTAPAVSQESDTSLESDTTIAVDPVQRSRDQHQLRQLVGRTIYRYRVEKELVRGRTGTVFQAVDEKSGQKVALKVLWPHMTSNENERERFIRAMQTMRPIRHENLVRLLNAAMTELHETGATLCWYAMEFVDGHNLRSVAARYGVAGMLDWKNVWKVSTQMAKAMIVAYEHGIVHRSIYPENILIPRAERIAKLGDLILARALEGTQGEQITRRGELVGDVAYMSPERTKGEAGDHRSDMFSLGVTLYEVLCGRRPFEAPTVSDLIGEIQMAEPLSPRLIQMSIDDRFEGVVLKLLEKNPSRRFETPHELLDELTRVGRYTGLIKD